MNVFTWSVTIRRTTPDHEPREGDPHYKYFHQVKRRLIGTGKWRCWICGSTDHLQMHHSMVEYSLQNGIDVGEFTKAFPEFGICSQEDFLKWVEGEGNLTILCPMHHILDLGIHTLTYPEWVVLKYWKKNLPPPGIRIRRFIKRMKEKVLSS